MYRKIKEETVEDSKETSLIMITTENETVSLEDTMKNEHKEGEIKQEPAEIYSESIGEDRVNWEPIMKDDNSENIGNIGSKRIKNEHNYDTVWIKCEVKNEALEMQAEKIKMEKDLHIEKIELTKMTEESILQNKSDCGMLMDINPKIVMNRTSSECAEVEDGAAIKPTEIIGKIEGLVETERMDLEIFIDMKNCDDRDTAQFHPHCSEYVKPDIFLESPANQKILKKQHHMICKKPSRKSFSCYNCNYSVCCKHHLTKHMKEHKNKKNTYPHSSKCKLSICMHCNMTFKSKKNLDDHTIKKHPDFIASVSYKIHECTHCTYKTTIKDHLAEHMLKHPEAAGNYDLSTCIHCNATFKRKRALNDHIIKKHPDFIASISCKIHECMYCTYKTTMKGHFANHILKHPEANGNYELSTCVHCNATFKRKQNLDDHIIRKHPDFIASISCKIHECTHCTYKTTIKHLLAEHMLKHPEADCELSTCIHCNATFKTKIMLNNHIIQKHPDFIESVSCKIHECTHCTYKTTKKYNLAKHMLKHPETPGVYQLSICIHCNALFKTKQSLNSHIVKKHPDFIASVSGKIHECTHCTYKTTRKHLFTEHMLKHPNATTSCELSTCIHCHATFKRKQNLDDHTVRKHPDFITAISCKIHECTHCTYKTARKHLLAEHNMLKHPEAATSYKLSTCLQCTATFKTKTMLNNHIIKKHPDFITSVSCKIHECTDCTYKTTKKYNLTKHMLKHPETAGSY